MSASCDSELIGGGLVSVGTGLVPGSCATMPGESHTYLTVGFHTVLRTVQDVAALTLLLAALVESESARRARADGVKVFTRRQGDWAFLELVAPGDQHATLWALADRLTSIPPTPDTIQATRRLLVGQAAAAHAGRGTVADLQRWVTLFGAPPAALAVPCPEDVAQLDVGAPARMLRHLAEEVPTAFVVVGDVVPEQTQEYAELVGVFRQPRSTSAGPAGADEAPRGPGGIWLRSDPDSAGTSVRLVAPFGSVAPQDFYTLTALAVGLGGTHFSPLRVRLRDELGLSYLPSAGVERAAGQTYLCLEADSTQPDLRLLTASAELLVEHLEMESWKEHWHEGVQEVLGVYESAWSTARGRGAFVMNALTLGVQPQDIVHVPHWTHQDDTQVLQPDVLRAASDGIAGVVVGNVDTTAARRALHALGLSTR